MNQCCSPEEESTNKVVRAVSHLVERMLRKISDCDKEKQEDYLIKFFKFLGTQKDLSTIGEKLIQYRAAIEVKELKGEAEEQKLEDKEEQDENNLDSLLS